MSLFSPNETTAPYSSDTLELVPDVMPTEGADGAPRPGNALPPPIIDVKTVRQDGKNIQIIESYPPVDDWSDVDVKQVAYMAKRIQEHHDSGREFPFSNEWRPNLAPLAALFFASQPTEIPEDFKHLFDDVLSEYEYRFGGGGGSRFSAPPPQRRPVLPLDVFLNIILRAPAPPPTWLTLNPTGMWLTEPKAVGAKRMANGLPEGTCALHALLCSGIKYSLLKNEKPEDWVGATVQKMVSVLDTAEQGYVFYDSLGREVLAKKVPNVGYHRFVVSNGHVTAFRTRITKEGSIFCPQTAGSSMYETMKLFDRHHGLRSPVSCESIEFHIKSGIRPPYYRSSMYEVPSMVLDACKAYPSILLDPTKRFPKPSGFETIHEYPPMETERSKITRHGFYRVDVQGFDASEVLIVAKNACVAWLYGDVILEAWPNKETFRVSGEFVTDQATMGKKTTLEHRQAIWPHLQAYANEQGRDSNSVEVITDTFYGLMNMYTGYIEKQTTRVVHQTAPTKGAAENDYYYYRSLCDEEYSVGEVEAEVLQHTRTTLPKTGAHLAKLAIYQYMALSLLETWRKILQVDPRAQIMRIHTDSIGFRMNPDLRETLLKQPFVGGKPGEYKVEFDSFATPAPSKLLADRNAPMPGAQQGANIAAREPRYITQEEVTKRIAAGQAPTFALFGPPGCGKTHTVTTQIIPALKNAGYEVKLMTPLLSHAKRLECTTLASFLTKKRDLNIVSHNLAKTVLVVDEIGLAQPHELFALRRYRPAGLIVVGDHRQLSRCGDLVHHTCRLNLDIVELKSHEHDRFGGSLEMRRVLNTLANVIDTQRSHGMHRSEGIGVWPNGLEMDLERAGLRFVDKMPEDPGTIFGWRLRHSKEIGGHTVHSSQGMTVGEKITITDFRCDPRLLYTAVSRCQALSEVSVLRTPPDSLRDT